MDYTVSISDTLILVKLATRFRALGATERLQIFHLLAVDKNRGFTLPEIVSQVGGSGTAIRRQLRYSYLVREDLLEEIAYQSVLRYRANLAVFKDMLAFVSPHELGHGHGLELGGVDHQPNRLG